MYDCVYPTRTARFGTALVPEVMTSLMKYVKNLWELYLTTLLRFEVLISYCVLLTKVFFFFLSIKTKYALIWIKNTCEGC